MGISRFESAVYRRERVRPVLASPSKGVDMLAVLLLSGALAADLDLTVGVHGGQLVSVTLPDADSAPAPALLVTGAKKEEVRVTLVELTPDGEDSWRIELLVEDIVHRRRKRAYQLLAHPTLVAGTGQEAEFMIGREVPVQGGPPIEWETNHAVLILATVHPSQGS